MPSIPLESSLGGSARSSLKSSCRRLLHVVVLRIESAATALLSRGLRYQFLNDLTCRGPTGPIPAAHARALIANRIHAATRSSPKCPFAFAFFEEERLVGPCLPSEAVPVVVRSMAVSSELTLGGLIDRGPWCDEGVPAPKSFSMSPHCVHTRRTASCQALRPCERAT